MDAVKTVWDFYDADADVGEFTLKILVIFSNVLFYYLGFTFSQCEL